ncbi:MAG: DUF1616 domain-containing protein [Salinigranum sp.]
MSHETDWRLLLPPSLRRFPADLVAVVAVVVLTVGAALMPVVRDTPLRIVFGLPFVLFVPGYALIAALFPEAGHPPTGEDAAGGADDSGIDGIERVALSFGTSIAVVPLIGLVLNFTPWGIRLVPILVSVGAFTLAAAYVGARRRQALDPDDRFAVPYRRWIGEARAELFEPESRTDLLLNVVLVLSVLLALSSVAYAVAVPKPGESFTEFYLLTRNSTGQLVADGYPTDFTAGQGQSLVVGIGNQEHKPMDYTVVTMVQRVRVQNNSTRVLDERELKRFHAHVANNETWLKPHTVAPRMTGDRLRLLYLLYRGDPPGHPTADNAYRELHLWINVSASNGSASLAPGTRVETGASGGVGGV